MHHIRHCGQRPELIPEMADVFLYLKRPAFAFFCVRASFANKQISTAEVRGLKIQCVCGTTELARCVHLEKSKYLAH
jgi:hypothetical protein